MEKSINASFLARGSVGSHCTSSPSGETDNANFSVDEMAREGEAVSKPTSSDVARRFLALKAVVGYAYSAPTRDTLRKWHSTWSPSECEKIQRQSEARRDAYWRPARESGLWSYLSPREQALASATDLTMSDRDQVVALWNSQSLIVMSWGSLTM